MFSSFFLLKQIKLQKWNDKKRNVQPQFCVLHICIIITIVIKINKLREQILHTKEGNWGSLEQELSLFNISDGGLNTAVLISKERMYFNLELFNYWHLDDAIYRMRGLNNDDGLDWVNLHLILKVSLISYLSLNLDFRNLDLYVIYLIYLGKF